MSGKLTEQERIYAKYGRHNAEQCWANAYAFAIECHARLAERPDSKSAFEGLMLAMESMANWAKIHEEWTDLLSESLS